MEGAGYGADCVSSWLAVWQCNLSYAQDPGQGEARRIWARVAFAAIDGAERAGYPTWQADASRFNLRALLIADLGPDDDPLWDPDRLASDVLAVLPLSLEQAAEWAADWRTRSRDEILALRTCKNSLSPMKVVADQMAEGPVRARIDRWLKLWPELP
ncbi:hypothetical protein GCM10012278_47620 [Nonomuraea glycinis]|uniref:Uncharacterized protein n=2 Tax=Nonomuraea glycinis TaxID=2047744 RepID=A0A918A9G9_9ACTN|nr:hypothetical protein GCM10012278_47620 [Nonomuraea glycinis]